MRQTDKYKVPEAGKERDEYKYRQLLETKRQVQGGER